MLGTFIFYIYCIFGLYVFFLAMQNTRTMRDHSFPPESHSQQFVSVMIPARNEASCIAACLDSLLQQTYEHYEILVIDDHSNDSTWDIISWYAEQHDCIHAFQCTHLPENWQGKNHALHQLVQHARGSLYLFTDADTIHARESVAFGVTNLKKNNIDFFSGFPQQTLQSIPVQLIVSLMHFSTSFLFPLFLQYRSRNPLFGLAIGQYIFMTRDAYQSSGGHEQIKSAITDDIHLAREVIKHGFRQGFLDIRDIVSCTMYSDTRSAFNGITRSIVDFFDKRVGLIIACTLLLTAFLIIPSLLFFYFLFAGIVVLPVFIGYLAIAIAWATIVIYHRYSVITALFTVVSLILPATMMIYGVIRILSKRGIIWKDRPVL